MITNHRAHDPLRQSHEISVTATEINISGYLENKPIQIPIQHNCRNWTTLFLDYTTDESVSISEFTYILDNDPIHTQKQTYYLITNFDNKNPYYDLVV